MSLQSLSINLFLSQHLEPESKEQRGKLRFLFLGRRVRADIFGRLFLGSQKFLQMAVYKVKSKNEESFVDINTLLSKKYPISVN
jgi:ABC-type antimicrobial peptide transport system permease subunit